jgi:non-ribosomal peptide synthetase-like protein
MASIQDSDTLLPPINPGAVSRWRVKTDRLARTPADVRWEADGDTRALSRPELLHELFEFQASRRPQQVALVCGNQEMTYDQVERRANQLAWLLRRSGVGKGSFVAILLPRSNDMYVALLAVLKAGAAYVPLDPDYPADRVAYILSDCGVHTLLTTSDLVDQRGDFAGHVVELDLQASEIDRQPPYRLPQAAVPTLWRDLCYVIYTSGSTGRPKGVQIEHRSACHLVRAEGHIFRVQPHDRVYQGFSLAFDASVEEIWLAFFAGATLVVGTSDMVHAGPALSGLLTQAGVTVLSCVPTLLAMLEDDIPTVRLLILGGEACPQALVERWWKPGRRMVNTYGPTEATVIATYADCHPQQRVTIGRSLPNYSACILDANLQLVAPGEVGELHLGGVGLARGYVGRPDLTREKFIANPLADELSPILYKTGDLARHNDQGDIEFMGRADGQVKLRGFRVELSEIEAVLLELPEILAAAVTVREDLPGVPQLVAYLVTHSAQPLDEPTTRSALRSRLPAYMMPAIFEVLDELPQLPSGKVDRGRLPAPRARQAATRPDHQPPRDEREKALAAVWERLFQPQPVSINDDFFLDLGGHSLLAAQMVSELRKDVRFQELSVLDIYRHPTIERLAARLAPAADEPAVDESPASDPAIEFHPTSSLAHFSCGLMQLIGLYFVVGFFSLQWLGPYLTYTWMIDNDYLIFEAILGSLATLVAIYPLMLAVAVAVKWTVIGRYKAGDYPLWGVYYFRWWFVHSILSAIPVNYLSGTPLLNWLYRLLGAKIGKGVVLGSDNLSAFDLISIGADSSIGTDAQLTGYTVEQGRLRIGPVHIGERCFVGTRSVVREHAAMADDSRLEDLSMLSRGQTISAGETWAGSPARCCPSPEKQADDDFYPSRLRRCGYGVLYALGVLIFPVIVLAAILPGMILMNHLNYQDEYYSYLVVSPLVAVSFIVFLCLEIALFKWLLLGKVEPGRYRVHSFFYWRKWFVDQLMELSLDVLGPLYATIYLAPWYRLLGAKLGKRAEISTASFISPDLLTIDDEGFIADAVSLGAARIDGGYMTVAATRIGKRSFIGNSALLPPGAVVPDNCLIGCLSAPPAGQTLAEGSSWLGSPSFFLPQRQKTTSFSEESTFKPTLKLWLQRAAIEFCRVTLPSTCFITITSVLLSIVLLIHEEILIVALLALFPLIYAAFGLAAALLVVAVKWLLMGRYRASEQPLWSTFVWKTELVNALHEHLACLFLTSKLAGTPFLCWFFRLLGAKIGRRVYMETTDLTEFDLVSIGDDAALNGDCTIQTHLFEDRVMKMSTVKIGSKCTVGSLSLVLYDTQMQPGSSLGNLSLLMKGESLPSDTRWEGIPAQLV